MAGVQQLYNCFEKPQKAQLKRFHGHPWEVRGTRKRELHKKLTHWGVVLYKAVVLQHGSNVHKQTSLVATESP